MSFLTGLDISYKNNIDLQLPLIVEKKSNDIYYPLINGCVAKHNNIHIGNDEFVVSVGSGVVIYKSLLEKFSSFDLQPFDERFALYGVDTSFFLRLKMIKSKGRDVNIQVASQIYHSLSRVNSTFSPFRHRERLYDALLTNMYYKDKSVAVLEILKMFIREIRHSRYKNIVLMLKVMMNKKHFRC